MAKEYIEREALIRYAEKQKVIIMDGTSIADAMRIQGNVFRECVETAPAADVVEVVHGKWMHDRNNLYGCNNCLHRETMSHKEKKKYCPNCGAKMDGERKEV